MRDLCPAFQQNLGDRKNPTPIVYSRANTPSNASDYSPAMSQGSAAPFDSVNADFHNHARCFVQLQVPVDPSTFQFNLQSTATGPNHFGFLNMLRCQDGLTLDVRRNDLAFWGRKNLSGGRYGG